MSGNKNKLTEGLIEIILEVVLSIVLLGVGALVASLCGISIDFENTDPDFLMLIGVLVLFVIFAVVYGIIKLIRKLRS